MYKHAGMEWCGNKIMLWQITKNCPNIAYQPKIIMYQDSNKANMSSQLYDNAKLKKDKIKMLAVKNRIIQVSPKTKWWPWTIGTGCFCRKFVLLSTFRQCPHYKSTSRWFPGSSFTVGFGPSYHNAIQNYNQTYS